MSILNTSLSALRVAQRALETTSHNIANVNTPGYSRQRVLLGTREATNFGFGSIGNGAEVQSVQRVYDQFLGDQVTSATSALGRFESFAALADRLGNLLNDPNDGLSSTMQSFYNAAGDVANDPASIGAREAMLGETRVVVDRFSQMASQLSGLDQEVNSRIAQDVADIDALAGDIAALNERISLNGGSDPSSVPNDLVDERQNLLNELAARVAITTTQQDDGSTNVFLGTGQLLVLGANSSNVSTQVDPLDPTKLQVRLGVDGGSSDITSAVQGGSLGGLLEFSEQGLGSAQNQLGRIATAFALDVNAQHQRGMDYDGDLGGEFFSIAGPAATPSNLNTGTGVVDFAIDDITQVGVDNYRLSFDGAAYSVLNTTDGTNVPFTGTGTAGDPLTFEGLTVSMTGTPAAGDQFSLEPMRDAAASLSLSITTGRDIAAALPVRTGADGANSGTATISIADINDPANANLLDDVDIEFTAPTTYQINGAGSFTFTPGQPISLNGYDIDVQGTPSAGDQFSVESNVGGIGDNRNILNIGQLPNQSLLDGETATLNDAVGTLVAQAGINGREAARGVAAQTTLLEQAQARVLEVSGVNLDEEAANLLQFQQSYQAAAQMIAVTDTLFATILNAVGR
ncbi:MAG: flagellar hook-associated protein FlgK [Gammaproteobacteria bacterium]